MKLTRTLLTIIAAAAVFAGALTLAGCETTTGGGIGFTLDLQRGLCVVSKDGKYTACWNPLTKGVTLKARVPGGIVRDLAYDSATRTYRADLPDGTTAIYGKDGLTFEAPLPAAQSAK